MWRWMSCRPPTRPSLPRQAPPQVDGAIMTDSDRSALRPDIERIDGMACGHKEAAAHPPAEAQVRASLREADAADQAPFRVVDDDPVELLTSHPPPAPEIAVDIASDAVRRAWTGIDENASVLDAPSV